MNWTSYVSLWWLLPAFVLAFLGAYFLYQGKSWISELKKGQRWLLIGLRFSVLSLLILLLFGVVFEYKSYQDKKPILLTVVDNSNSVLNYKDSSLIKEKLLLLQEEARAQLGDQFEYVFAPLFPDSVQTNFVGQSTNLSAQLEAIRTTYINENVGAVLYASDGNFNQGYNPVYVAEKFDFVPFYTLGVGDTVPKKDQYIKDVVANEYAYLNNTFPIQIEIEGRKLKGEKGTVELLADGKLLSQQSFTYSSDFAFKQLTFEVEAKKVGIQRFTVRLKALGQEYNLKNNQKDVFVEVLEARNRILLLAESPHPDIAAIKSALETNQNLEVSSHLFSKWDKNTKNVDMVVWHDPGSKDPQAVQDLLEKDKIPTLYVFTPNSTNAFVSKLNSGLVVPAGRQTDDVEPSFNSSFETFTVSEELVELMNFLPPLKMSYGKWTFPSSAQPLLYQRLGSIIKKDPLFFFAKKANQKYAVICGEGVWRWKIQDYAKNGNFDLFNELFLKTTQYLVTKSNKSQFVVHPPQRRAKGEDIEFTAEVYNDAMELYNKSEVRFVLVDENKKRKDFNFSKTEKAYQLNLGSLEPGLYQWSASTTANGKKLEKSGSLVINDVLIEQLTNEANHMILRQMADQTEGEFATFQNRAKLYQSISQRKDLTTVSYPLSKFLELIDWTWLFWGLLLLFTGEWFLRKWWGGY